MSAPARDYEGARFETSEAPGQSFLIDEFDAANEDAPIADEDYEAIGALYIGESHTIHGGAGGDTTITRVS